MLVLGLLLIVAGGLAVAAALLSSSGSATFLGTHVGAGALFFLGLAAGLAVLWGYALAKHGARRSWRLRRENRELRQQHARAAQGERSSEDPPTT